MGMGPTLLDAASVNSAVISRGVADCATARGGGTRTSLFGSIAQRFEALQSAAGSSHGMSVELEGNQPARSEGANMKRGFWRGRRRREKEGLRAGRAVGAL
jgi:hypothetical protein